MKKACALFALLLWITSACSAATQPPPAPPPAAESVSPSAAPAAPSKTKEPSPPAATSAPASGSRKALLGEIQNSVYFRAAPNSQPQPAFVGMEILPQSGIETGADGRARLDLQPEGTIVRVGPNSSFTLTELNESEGKPKTTLELFWGKVYILLNGGSLQVKTPGGVASVQGSVMSVTYNPNAQAIKIACLEGHCAAQNEEGNEVELTGGEMSVIFEDEAPTDPMMIDNEEVQDWYDEIPEMPDFFEEMPDPEDFPDPYFDFDWDYEMPTFEPGATLDPNITPDPALTENPTDWLPTEDPGGQEPPTEEPAPTEPPP